MNPQGSIYSALNRLPKLLVNSHSIFPDCEQVKENYAALLGLVNTPLNSQALIDSTTL